jgi:thiamine biosynthesis lipoprotein
MIDFKRRRTAQALAALAVAPLLPACAPRQDGRLAAFTGQTMAGTYSVKIARPGALSVGAREALAGECFAAVDAVDRAMSTYRSDSELSRLNRHKSDVPYDASPALAEVLATAQEVSRASGGAFDVTVGPLVNAWGFGPAGRGALPDADALAALRSRVDWRALALDSDNRTVRKARPDAYLDLSGIAQGYGADRIAAALEARGFGDYLVEVSGEVRARGTNADGMAWRVGIERPDAAERTPYLVVPLARGALATSGDYRNWYERDGRRYAHEIDPASGSPTTHRLASVSVVHAHAAAADAWATGLFVLGPDEGLRVAEREGLAAYFLVREPDGRFTERLTSAFGALGAQSVGRG